MKKITISCFCTFFLLLAGCSEAPKPAEKAAEAKPAEPVTGRYALFQMYTAARAWAPDIETLKMSSIPVQGVAPQPGKSGAWQVTFVSARNSRARSYTYSVVESEGLHKGVFAGQEEGWSGPKGLTKPIPMAGIRTDSDAAYETAMKKGAEYSKKNPDKPITYLLERTNKYPDPAWRVIWGESVGTSNFSIYVDAATGEYLETMH